jgi:Zn-dependent oligopeptidase
MLENWCWEEEPLRRMSGLYTNESEALPDPLLTSMVAAKNLNSALMTLRQVFVTSPETLNHKPQTLVRRP